MNYGWIVLGIITLFEGISGFGRTSALSPFLKDLCHDLDLSIAQISGAYALANLFAGLALPYVGRIYDRCKTANFLRIYIIVFSGAFVSLSMLKFMQFNSFINFCIFLLGFWGIRTSVHAYTVAGRSTAALWFDKKRGLATALSCFLLSTIASFMPWMNYKLHEKYEWYEVWIVVGLIWGLVTFWFCNFIKDPQNKKAVKTIPKVDNHAGNTFIRKPIFWLIMLAIFFKEFQNTGIAFHLIPMSEAFGAKPETITLCFIFISIVNSTVTFVFGHFFEKINLKLILLLFLIFDCCFLFCFKGAASTPLLCCFVIFCGIYWALNQIVTYLVIPKVFGTKSIGKIHGYVAAFSCLGSSSGPFFIGLIKRISSYQNAMSFCILCSFILLCYGFIIKIQAIDTKVL